MKISRALLSLSDKTGLLPFARALVEEFGVELLSTGGTAKLLRDAGLAVTEVADFTAHQEQAQAHGIRPIDLLVVNLYPFRETVAKPGVTLEEAIEQIDIGGPSMLRSAAKNNRSVTVVTDPADYEAVLAAMRENEGETTLSLREHLAVKVFQTTSTYDGAIASFLNREQETGSNYDLSLPLVSKLRYGENSHQEASLYGGFNEYFQKLHGKELSFNNILDISAAAELIGEFEEPTVAILKHTNPCGVGSDPDLREAWDKAFATDKQAPFGGIIVFNRPVTEAVARDVSEIFSEVIIAPEFEPDARALLQRKKNLRLMRQLQPAAAGGAGHNVRSVVGGVLVQDRDARLLAEEGLKVVTKRQPTEAETRALMFGWRTVKHVKSNAIVFTGADRTLGVGAGQMSRVDSARIAVWKAADAGLSLAGSIVASDAFFPFPDGLVAAAEAGATAALQPGGSVRDAEVIAAADERGVAMAFTGVRVFRH